MTDRIYPTKRYFVGHFDNGMLLIDAETEDLPRAETLAANENGATSILAPDIRNRLRSYVFERLTD